MLNPKYDLSTLFVVMGLLFVSNVLGYKDVHLPNVEKTTTTTEVLKPWVRTITQSGMTVNEIVTPTVVAGVTFSAQPPVSTDPLQPWVSLDKSGKPKTVKPQIKNGRTNRASPTYETYFQEVYTTTKGYEEMGKPHNMDPNEVHEELIEIDEDKTYVSLNPIIRCTPKRYFKKGSAKHIDSAPFCTPSEKSELKVGATHFVTWYTRFFTTTSEEDPLKDIVAKKVKLHLSYLEESPKEKGFKKRELSTHHPATFFVTEWINNVDGVYPMVIDEQWLDGKREKKVLLTIQPDYITDEEFDPLMEDLNPLSFRILVGSRVFKKSKDDIDLQHANAHHQPIWYIVVWTPGVVIIAIFGMYLFIKFNSRYRDFSDIQAAALKKKHRIIGKVQDMKKFKGMKNHRYEELPMYNMDQKKDKNH